MKSENKTSDFSNDKNYIRIVLSRKTLVAAICIILAIVAVAFVLHEVFREKYNIAPTVKVEIPGAYKYVEDKDGNTSRIYLRYDGNDHFANISIVAEGKDLTKLPNYRWGWSWKDTNEKGPIKEKGFYELSLSTLEYTQDGKLKYQMIFVHEVVIIIE
ncbi:MAG: hypothetical protein IKC47_04265 [Clostridia bacterium]|nr:hypothetical protein [Clostridia bacterium]